MLLTLAIIYHLAIRRFYCVLYPYRTSYLIVSLLALLLGFASCHTVY